MINKFIESITRKTGNKIAFTLVEVLLAVAIVGVIAALVLPSVVTQYQNKVSEYKVKRQMDAVKSALNGIVVNENTSKFTDTLMYSPTTTYSVDNTAGKFLKKYFRVAKYCGAPSGGKSDCFAKEYFEYSNGGKKDFKNLALEGACALLKNGSSICITPQRVGNNPVQVALDINGPKGPNILGRDLFLASSEETQISLVDIANSSPDRVTDNVINAENKPPIVPDPDDPCASAGDWSNACCQYRLTNNLIKDSNDVCCGNVDVAGSVPACYKEAEIHANYYPTTSQMDAIDLIFGTKPYIKASSNTYITPSSLRIPSGLSIRIRCQDGSYGPVLSSEDLQKAIDTKSGDFQFDGKIKKKACAYPNETLLWDGNKSTTIKINGLTYKLKQH